jgi:hypothetical protein
MNNLDFQLLDPLLLKTGRVAARLGRESLGTLVNASVPTIKNLESKREAIESVRSSTLHSILKCLSEKGIELGAKQEPDGSVVYSVTWKSPPQKAKRSKT